MNSRDHAVVSLVAAALILAVTTPPYPAWAVVAIAVVAGVGIDLDHFLIAWWKTGGLEPVRRCLRDPIIVFVDQSAIFESGEVGAITRLLSHVVIGGIVVPLLWFRWPYLAGLVGASLYGHLLADLYATDRERVTVRKSDLPDDSALAAASDAASNAVANGGESEE